MSFETLGKYLYMLFAGRSVLGKTVPEVLSTARGRRLRAVLKTEGTVFPNTDRPRPVNNVFIFFFYLSLFGFKKPWKNLSQNLCLYTRGFDFNVECDLIDKQESSIKQDINSE